MCVTTSWKARRLVWGQPRAKRTIWSGPRRSHDIYLSCHTYFTVSHKFTVSQGPTLLTLLWLAQVLGIGGPFKMCHMFMIELCRWERVLWELSKTELISRKTLERVTWDQLEFPWSIDFSKPHYFQVYGPWNRCWKNFKCTPLIIGPNMFPSWTQNNRYIRIIPQSSKPPISHVTGYQPIRDQCFLIRLVGV